LNPESLFPIILRGEHIGLVAVCAIEDSLQELDRRASEHAATVCALYFARQREFTLAEARLGASLLGTLLEGAFESTPQALERARMGGFRRRKFGLNLFRLDQLGWGCSSESSPRVQGERRCLRFRANERTAFTDHGFVRVSFSRANRVALDMLEP
jgi:hypothetical protein